MSIFTQAIDVNEMKAIKSVDGVYIVLEEFCTDGSYEAIEIKTPMEAHILRDVVNKACDMFLKNH